MEDLRLLVADDRKSYARLMAHLARLALGRGIRIVTEQEGSCAIARLLIERFDMVITDLRMPGASGLDVARIARQERPPPEVVLATAHMSGDEERECARLGVAACLRKPFDPDDAIRVIQEVGRRARERREGLSMGGRA